MPRRIGCSTNLAEHFMFWLTGRLGPTKHILPVSWMLFQSPKRMRISGSFMTQRVSSVSTQIRDEEAKSKLCKVRSVQANDTIKLDLETNKITDFVKFNVGNVVMVTGGRNRGRVGVIKNREKHKVSFETIHVQDATGHEFATRLGNVFTIGKGERPWVSLSKGKGIKLTIIEEAKKRQAAQQAATA